MQNKEAYTQRVKETSGYVMKRKKEMWQILKQLLAKGHLFKLISVLRRANEVNTA